MEILLAFFICNLYFSRLVSWHDISTIKNYFHYSSCIQIFMGTELLLWEQNLINYGYKIKGFFKSLTFQNNNF